MQIDDGVITELARVIEDANGNVQGNHLAALCLAPFVRPDEIRHLLVEHAQPDCRIVALTDEALVVATLPLESPVSFHSGRLDLLPVSIRFIPLRNMTGIRMESIQVLRQSPQLPYEVDPRYLVQVDHGDDVQLPWEGASLERWSRDSATIAAIVTELRLRLRGRDPS